MNIKEELYKSCLEFINNRLLTVTTTISDIQNSLQSETKSSAGDKHETGRAMLQLEREKAGHQLAEIEKQKEILQNINIESKHQRVAFGSVVFTSKANYFIAISAGEISLKDCKIYAISVATPMAQLLLSKMVGDTIQFRDDVFTITKIE
ncbi:GreA/GreB family elongation factor [Winogradskyella costae]|jgi:transcription elongation GreA/GreB family factor|uniref:3-oxoacyl-ACP synthase n=1 Tax=Winogradskyella costae TaxID=2697008 RepID=UPI0015C6B219|nr:3-oxoacyl-ACP synthase [Winogradskyella costae]